MLQFLEVRARSTNVVDVMESAKVAREAVRAASLMFGAGD